MASLLLLAVGCGGGHEEGEHTFESYDECYAAETGEGATPVRAFEECDEMFMVMHADHAACLAFYGMQPSVPAAAATARCDALFPGGGGDAGPATPDAGM